MCCNAQNICYTSYIIIIKFDNVYLFSAKDIAVDIEPKRDTAARNGEEQTILCKVPRQIDYCRMELPRGGVLNLKDSSITPIDGITYFGTGLKAGQCGIRISHVNEHHDGVYKCTMGVEGLLREATQSVRIIVASESLSSVSFRRDFHGIKFSNVDLTCGVLISHISQITSLSIRRYLCQN